MRFSYRGRDPAGKVVRGVVEADDRLAALTKLRGAGVAATAIKRARPGPGAGSRTAGALLSPWRRGAEGRMTSRELAFFCRQLATLLASGVPMLAALEALGRQSSSRKLSSFVSRIASRIASGNGVAGALLQEGSRVPPILPTMVEAGEESGTLDESLASLAGYFEKEDAFERKARAALAYPLVLVVSLAGVAAFAVGFVVPAFARLLSEMGAKPPRVTQLLIDLSALAAGHPALSVGALVAAGAGLGALGATPRGRELALRGALLLPPVRDLAVKRALGRFCRTLGTSLKSGIPIMRALAVTGRTVLHRDLEKAVAQAREAVNRGESLVESLARSRAIPPTLLKVIEVGERSGRTDELLLKAASFYEGEVEAAIEKISSLVQPVLLVAMGIGIAILVASVVVPLFEAYSSLAF
ncbi:MAG: type II secretion system F family protein [Bacillota bacterium]